MHISKFMLSMTASAFEKVGMNADRKPIYSEPISLENIYVDFTDASISGANGKEPGDSGTFFFDCANSKPEGFIPKKGMKLVIGPEELVITSVHMGMGVNGLEHYECGVN